MTRKSFGFSLGMTSFVLTSIPIAFGLVFLPKIPLTLAARKRPEGYDNEHPRDQQAKLEGWGRRAVAAHDNGWESFPAFSIGALVAHVGGGNPEWAVRLCIAYLVARALYCFIYVAGYGTLRSAVWSIGFLSTVALMFLPLFS